LVTPFDDWFVAERFSSLRVQRDRMAGADFLVTRIGKVAAAVVISRSFFGEDRVAVVGSRSFTGGKASACRGARG
jgi:hypothetical protein